jgi:hypothetical protein
VRRDFAVVEFVDEMATSMVREFNTFSEHDCGGDDE